MALRLDLENNPDFLADLIDQSEDRLSRDALAEKWNASAGFISDRRKKALAGKSISSIDLDSLAGIDDEKSTFDKDEHGNLVYGKTADRIIPLSEWIEKLREDGFDPDNFTHSHGHSVWTQHTRAQVTKTLYANKFTATLKVGGKNGEPAWPVIQPTRTPIILPTLKPTPRATRFKTAVLGADTQIGFDMDESGNLTPYHDDAAMDIFRQIVALENPTQTVILGDIIDLAEQGRWAQEARFAHTTQPALERARLFAAETRAGTNGEIHWIEGNHDKRMQSFMEANAKASMGLRRAGYPESWPVMSIPHLVGLDDFDVRYIDAYPAGVHWITDGLRAIHGTKANSKGSTAAQYANEMPHISTAFGHTHRLEIQSKTTFDRAGKIRTMNINPGCLCRVDGAVPSVHGARHLDGSKATYYEDWQQGVAIIRYLDDGKFYVEMIQIDDGVGFYGGQELVAA